MRFKIDENLPSELSEMLRAANHDAATVLADSVDKQLWIVEEARVRIRDGG
ncbi:MAG: DUF5615 family PIN-like protein [Phycisphaerae bacterium]